MENTASRDVMGNSCHISGNTSVAWDRFFDAHFHIIDPGFPLHENNGYLPDYFTIADYRDRTSDLNVRGGAVVAGSFQGTEHDYLVAALREMGTGFVGVIQLDPDVADEQIRQLDQQGCVLSGSICIEADRVESILFSILRVVSLT